MTDTIATAAGTATGPDPVAEMFEIEAWSDLVRAAPREVARATGLEIIAAAGFVAVVAPGIPSPEFNRAVGLGVESAAGDEDLDRVLDLFRSRGVTTGWVQVMEGALPAGLGDRLRARGAMGPRSRWSIVTGAATEMSQPDTALAIREMDSTGAAESGRVFAAAYGLPPVFADWNAGLVGRSGWRVFGAWDGGRLVAVSYLWVKGARAMLIGAATLPEARRKGAQSALLAARITAAAASGVRVVQTHSWIPEAPGGNPSLNNMGRAGLVQRHVRLNYVVGP